MTRHCLLHPPAILTDDRRTVLRVHRTNNNSQVELGEPLQPRPNPSRSFLVLYRICTWREWRKDLSEADVEVNKQGSSILIKIHLEMYKG